MIYFPYKMVAGKVEFDTVYASAGENKVFRKCAWSDHPLRSDTLTSPCADSVRSIERSAFRISRRRDR